MRTVLISAAYMLTGLTYASAQNLVVPPGIELVAGNVFFPQFQQGRTGPIDPARDYIAVARVFPQATNINGNTLDALVTNFGYIPVSDFLQTPASANQRVAAAFGGGAGVDSLGQLTAPSYLSKAAPSTMLVVRLARSISKRQSTPRTSPRSTHLAPNTTRATAAARGRPRQAPTRWRWDRTRYRAAPTLSRLVQARRRRRPARSRLARIQRRPAQMRLRSARVQPRPDRLRSAPELRPPTVARRSVTVRQVLQPTQQLSDRVPRQRTRTQSRSARVPLHPPRIRFPSALRAMSAASRTSQAAARRQMPSMLDSYRALRARSSRKLVDCNRKSTITARRRGVE
jgi:hypothetical protein